MISKESDGLLTMLTALNSGKDMGLGVITMGTALAALAGAMGGYVFNKATAPRIESVKNVQRKFLVDKLKQEVALINDKGKKLKNMSTKQVKPRTLRMGV